MTLQNYSVNKGSIPTLKEHILIAKNLVMARRELMAMYCTGPKRFKKIYKSEGMRIDKVVRHIDEVKNILDGVYCDLVDKETLEELGYIYYGGK